MTEFRLDLSPSIPAGRVVFRILNQGTVPHSLVMFPEDADAPPLDQQLHGSVRRAIAPLAEVFPVAPGKAGTFAVDLVGGQRYGFMSTTAGTDKRPDFLKGMNAEFRAVGRVVG